MIINESAISSHTRDREVFEDYIDIRFDQLSTNTKKNYPKLSNFY